MAFPEAVSPVVPGRLDRLRIAFSALVARRIVAADGLWDLGEVELMARTFPTEMMQRAGFLDHRRELTPEVDRVFRQALAELPKVLTLSEKLDLLSLFWRTCQVDGEMHPKEMQVLEEASAMLEVPYPTLLTHLRHLSGAATLVPPPERE